MNERAIAPRRDQPLDVEVAIVGSGPAGSAVALEVAKAGLKPLVLEEGPRLRPGDLGQSGFRALSTMYRDLGGSLSSGPAPIPFLQGRAVGGTSVMNGAISWRLPRHVHDEWRADDPALADQLSFESIEAVTDEVEAFLEIRPTDPRVSGANNQLLARGAEALGLAHRPISRNVRACEGRGQCLEGCPIGRKLSMDQTYLQRAAELGARVLPNTRVVSIKHDGHAARGVFALTEDGAGLEIRARVVVLAASAIQTPLLLIRSGLDRALTGWGFQAHPGVSVSGFFATEVEVWRGATQGHEVIGLVPEGIKIEALGFDRTVAAMRLPGVGERFKRGLRDLAHYAHFGAAVRASSRGRVSPGRRGRPKLEYRLNESDLRTMRRAVSVLGQLMFAAGAEYVVPGVHGFDPKVHDAARMRAFESEGPLDPRAYQSVITHMFGTARMGSDRRRSVVGLDFRHHDLAGLYVADSSVFPGNTGVNPQTSILALATLCGRQIAQTHA